MGFVFVYLMTLLASDLRQAQTRRMKAKICRTAPHRTQGRLSPLPPEESDWPGRLTHTITHISPLNPSPPHPKSGRSSLKPKACMFHRPIKRRKRPFWPITIYTFYHGYHPCAWHFGTRPSNQMMCTLFAYMRSWFSFSRPGTAVAFADQRPVRGRNGVSLARYASIYLLERGEE